MTFEQQINQETIPHAPGCAHYEFIGDLYVLRFWNNMSACEGCKSWIRRKHVAYLLEQLGEGELYVLPTPDTVGAMRRFAQNVKIAGGKYRTIGDKTYTTFADRRAAAVEGDYGSALYRQFMATPSTANVSGSSNWSLARPNPTCTDDREEDEGDDEQPRMRSAAPWSKIAAASRALGLQIIEEVPGVRGRIVGLGSLNLLDIIRWQAIAEAYDLPSLSRAA